MCMVARWQGNAAAMEGDFGSGPLPPRYVLQLPNARALPAPPEGRLPEDLRVELEFGGAVAIAFLLSRTYVRCLLGSGHSASHPEFGQLAEPGDFDGPLHAVVLTGYRDDGFEYLDPFFLEDAQPRFLPEGEFDACWGGECMLFGR